MSFVLNRDWGWWGGGACHTQSVLFCGLCFMGLFALLSPGAFLNLCSPPCSCLQVPGGAAGHRHAAGADRPPAAPDRGAAPEPAPRHPGGKAQDGGCRGLHRPQNGVIVVDGVSSGCKHAVTNSPHQHEANQAKCDTEIVL